MFRDADSASAIPRVKICGITNRADANAAIECGADSLGFNLFPGSKRFVDLHRAGSWISELPPVVGRTAVVVDPQFEYALSVAQLGVFGSLQLHGSEPPEFCRRLAEAQVQFSKAIAVTDRASVVHLPSFSTETLVLDSHVRGSFGGSGRTFPWEIAREFGAAHPNVRVILAGGLTPENVAEAVRIVRPFGVDVTSGVEAEYGRKDHGRLRAFVDAARGR